MCNGTLRVQTYAARESAPVGNVRIRLRSADDQLAQEMVFYTDDGGVAPDLELPAPPASLSLDENATQRPYSVWDLTADKESYQTLTLEGLQVFAGQVALAELELRPMQRLGAPAPLPDSFDVPPHQLYSPGSGAPSSAPVQLCEPSPAVLTAPIIPETITVHLGKPAASAQNVTVSFRKYIANVASSEVYPTWANSTRPIKQPPALWVSGASRKKVPSGASMQKEPACLLPFGKDMRALWGKQSGAPRQVTQAVRASRYTSAARTSFSMLTRSLGWCSLVGLPGRLAPKATQLSKARAKVAPAEM